MDKALAEVRRLDLVLLTRCHLIDFRLASATLHLYSKEPLFERLMVIGGTHLFFAPLPPTVQDQIYGAVIKKLELESSPLEVRVEALNTLPVKDLYTKFGFELPLLPVCDDQLVPSKLAGFSDVSSKNAKTTDLMPGKVWCKDLFIGDCQYDVSTAFIQLVKLLISLSRELFIML